MRISDWSSDVCSSDLVERQRDGEQPRKGQMPAPPVGEAVARRDRRPAGKGPCLLNAAAVGPAPEHPGRLDPQRADAQEPHVARRPDLEPGGVRIGARLPTLEARVGLEDHRSEEHTSEIQSLTLISYASFCFKTQTNK